MRDDEVKMFALKSGYDDIKYIKNWRNYKVYEPISKKNRFNYIGVPYVILVNSHNKIRMSTTDECMLILEGEK